MSLASRYLGFELPHPLMPGASPLGGDLDAVRRLEDAGAAMIVLPSLFAEQIDRDDLRRSRAAPGSLPARRLAEFPDPDEYPLAPDDYLDHLAAVKRAVAVPVVASLNGTSPGDWTRYAGLLERAGADALELNLYGVAIDPAEDAAAVERRQLEAFQAVKQETGLPVAVKLSPFYSSLAHFARQLEEQGAEGLVLFNRFAQPDMDLDQGRLRRIDRSTPAELPLRLRWIGVLSGRARASLACSGGVHSAADAVKALLAGAQAVQVVSALLEHGPEHLARLRGGLQRWIDEHREESVRAMQGRLNLQRCPDPAEYSRADYVRALHGHDSA